ncbi:related to ALG14 - component of UDP-GlcNAc transferase [Ustilago trichophora]|uniref:UDP-N-acetylglucosamine transferase subunit ALG14 n=1 Tax=Ustilago trichophora TaxID=86804 RepID=A0A5C3E403_9BASI|nr:related to ALG14 - component of UDP-GlcNAc transferase [Ustilago trichophora]
MDEIAQNFEAAKLHLQQPINKVLPPSLLLYLIPPLPSLRLILTLLSIALVLLLRIWYILPARVQSKTSQILSRKSNHPNHLTVAVFLGSGGHTTELLQLVSALPIQRYTQRIYLVSSGDQFSLEKAKQLECNLFPSSSSTESLPKVIQIPRARKVHQTFLTTPLTLATSIAFCIHHIALRPLIQSKGKEKRILADVILMNGPGTCVPIVAAVWTLRVLGLQSPKLIYVESFARVDSFSLTAKLIRPFVDRFVLQWPRDPSQVSHQIRSKASSNTVFSGWLV